MKTFHEALKMLVRISMMFMTLAGLIASEGFALRAQGPSGQSPRQLVEEAWQVINQDFLDPTYNHHDWLKTRHKILSKQYASTSDAYTAIAAMLRQLDDPQTRLMDPAVLNSTMQELTGELADIGFADPWLTQDQKTGELEIGHLIADSPALKAGLRPRDVIAAIDGTPTAKLSRDEAFMRIRGQQGTPVRLTVRRSNATFDVSVVREVLTLRTVRGFARSEHGRIVGYIALSQFAAKSADEMRHAVMDLLNRKAEGFVLDLRNNPGGVATGSQLTDKPLVVLVNAATASAAEILAGALKDNRRALLVGSTTFGQGLVHSVHTLSDGSGLVVAVAYFKTPAGRAVHRQGIEPDLTVEVAEQVLIPSEVATPKDVQYEKAVEELLRHANS
jgi:carboxyl-terminal processing protease